MSESANKKKINVLVRQTTTYYNKLQFDSRIILIEKEKVDKSSMVESNIDTGGRLNTEGEADHENMVQTELG